MDDVQQPVPPTENKPGGNVLGMPLTILSFCIPLAGAIIWFMKKDKEPAAAKTACTAALIGIGVGVLINVIVTIV